MAAQNYGSFYGKVCSAVTCDTNLLFRLLPDILKQKFFARITNILKEVHNESTFVLGMSIFMFCIMIE